MGIEELPDKLNLPPPERERALNEIEEERERKREFIADKLKSAMELYKKDPEKGEVRLFGKEMTSDGGDEEEWDMKTKIVEIVDENIVTSWGEKIPLWHIDGVEMIDDSDEA